MQIGILRYFISAPDTSRSVKFTVEIVTSCYCYGGKTTKINNLAVKDGRLLVLYLSKMECFLFFTCSSEYRGRLGNSIVKKSLPVEDGRLLLLDVAARHVATLVPGVVSRRLTGQHIYLATSCRSWQQFTLTGQCARFSVFTSGVMCLA